MRFPRAMRRALRRRSTTVLLAASAALAGTAAPAAAEPSVAGAWLFDEPAGQVVHDTGPQGLHGVLGSADVVDGDDPLRIPGPVGGALRFGGGAFVAVAAGRRLDLRTPAVEAVVRSNGSPGTYRYLVAHRSLGCTAGSYGLYTAGDGGVAFYVFDGERFFVSASTRVADVWDGAWHRVTGTFDGRKVRAFVDGREVGVAFAPPAGTEIEYESMPTGTAFGSFRGSCRLPFTGDLDEVRIRDATASLDPVGPIAPPLSPPSPPATAPPTTAQAPAGRPALVPAAAGTTIRARPRAARCAVRASITRVRAARRARFTLRGTESGRPLRRARLRVRRTGRRQEVLASPRTDARGRASVVLATGGPGRLRVGVTGRPECTPAFIRVTARR